MIRRVRLVSGLIMFGFVVSHFLNHALGLVSLDVAEDAMWYLYRVYTSRLGSALLYGAFLAHFLLALYALWQRQTLRLSAPEAVQYALGFLIPLLGLIVFPYATLFYVLAYNPVSGGVGGWGWIFVVLGFVFDIGHWVGGGVTGRRRYASA